MAKINVGDVLYTDKIYSSPRDLFQCTVLSINDGKICFSAKNLAESSICMDSILESDAANFFNRVAVTA